MTKQAELTKEVSLKFSFFTLVFIFVVVLFHSDFRYFYPIIENLTHVSTSYFFCVSAFFFYRGLNDDNINSRLKRRCKTLLLPYILWNFLYMIPNLMASPFSVSNVIRGITVAPFCTPSWYLLTLFIFFLFAPLINQILRKKHLTILLLCVGIAISYLGYIRFQQELALVPFVGGYLIRMVEYLTPFLFGAVIGTWFHQKLYVSWKKGIIGIISSGVMLLLLFSNIPLAMRWLLWVVLPIAIWNATPEGIFKHVRFLHLATNPAFTINMTHCYFLIVCKTILAKTELFTGKYLSALCVIFTVFASYLVYYLLKKFLPNTLKHLTGNRT